MQREERGQTGEVRRLPLQMLGRAYQGFGERGKFVTCQLAEERRAVGAGLQIIPRHKRRAPVWPNLLLVQRHAPGFEGALALGQVGRNLDELVLLVALLAQVLSEGFANSLARGGLAVVGMQGPGRDQDEDAGRIGGAQIAYVHGAIAAAIQKRADHEIFRGVVEPANHPEGRPVQPVGDRREALVEVLLDVSHPAAAQIREVILGVEGVTQAGDAGEPQPVHDLAIGHVPLAGQESGGRQRAMDLRAKGAARESPEVLEGAFLSKGRQHALGRT